MRKLLALFLMQASCSLLVGNLNNDRAFCGDSILQDQEACDDGNTISGDGCSSSCRSDETCGNGLPDIDEECDDGNILSGDGCSAICVVERCGNNFADPGEECDDGDGANGDGCDNNCTNTACGNNIQFGAEECDDGNLTNGDGCTNQCLLEGCANGRVDLGEECDDGNSINGDDCDVDCSISRCGNGIVAGEEECDDGNNQSGDGCNASCTSIEVCGDGNVDIAVGEECDDANTADGDDCTSACQTVACGDGIKKDLDGDGIVDAGDEGCDDGNTLAGDGCNNGCQPESGFTCVGSPSACNTTCGDGIIAGVEECDDANTNNNDDCLATCQDAACGDGFTFFAFEECDDANAIDGDACEGDCSLPQCGNGIIDEGEFCYERERFFGGLTIGSTQGLAIGRVNGDIFPDAVMVQSTANRLLIFLNNGDGNLSLTKTITTVSGPIVAELADVNQDGRLDLLVPSGSNTVAIFLNTGGVALFADSPDVTLSVSVAGRLALGDFNDDTHNDVVVSNFTANTVSLFLGNGDGTFLAPIVLSDTDFNQPLLMSSADFNQDGVLDLLVANFGNNIALVFFGNGDGTFVQSFTITSQATGVSFVDTVVGDLNGDGAPDIGLLRRALAGPPNAAVEFHLSNVLSNTFSGPSFQVGLETNTGSFTLALADLNRDGDLDYYSNDLINDAVFTSFGNGDGTFQSFKKFASNDNPLNVESADLNQDGILDLLTVGNLSTSRLSAHFGKEDGTFEAIRVFASFPGLTRPTFSTTGDLNNDGRADLVFSASGGSAIGVMLNDTNALLASAQFTATDSTPNGLRLTLLNNDAFLDLIVAQVGTNKVSTLLGNGNGTFQPRVDLPASFQGPGFIEIADLDGDNDQDLIVSENSGNRIAVLLFQSGVFQSPTLLATNSAPGQVAVGNFNGDAFIDLAVVNLNSNNVSVFLGNGDGTFQPKQDFATDIGPSSLVAGDFNQDGSDDLAITCITTDVVNVLLNTDNNTGSFQPKQIVATGIDPKFIHSGDFNNDGSVDLFLINTLSSFHSFLFGDGSGGFLSTPFPIPAANFEAASLGDLNGDGLPDIIGARTFSEQLQVFLSNP